MAGGSDGGGCGASRLDTASSRRPLKSSKKIAWQMGRVGPNKWTRKEEKGSVSLEGLLSCEVGWNGRSISGRISYSRRSAKSRSTKTVGKKRARDWKGGENATAMWQPDKQACTAIQLSITIDNFITSFSLRAAN
eukprot:6212623-Pleurochrysis_carterae.AAC.2